MISLESKSNQLYFDKEGINYSGVKINSIYKKPYLLRLNFIKNITRYFSDNNISKLFEKKINRKFGLIEFMDIHSEGYQFLRKNPDKRNRTLIRSHTPFSLLRKYYTRDELRGVDTWFSFRREKKCFEWTGNITAPSHDLKKQLIRIFNIKPKKIKVIPNILDTNHFIPLKNETNNKFNILHVGRFERAKGVETLIKAFIQIAKKYSDINLTCVGNPRGPSFDRCKKTLIKENLIQNVSFTGFAAYEELPRYYSQSDLVVVPSEIYESFSYTVAQGMACGKPVIASDIGGIPETVNMGHAGILFKVGNVEDLIDKIEFMYLNVSQRKSIGHKGRKHVVENYSMEALGQKYIEYYQSIIV
tara:strand:+ start:2696 stop:3772 length:1077 start_codon:yes stop_codon:yes gene_type:complete